MNDHIDPMGYAIDVAVAELHALNADGPHFRIIHRFRKPGCACGPGEQIVAIQLLHHGREFQLPLSLALLLIFDFLAKHSRIAQSASHIVAGMRADAFCIRHGANTGSTASTRRISRACLKEFVRRIRLALEQAFKEAGLTLGARMVLLSQKTVFNQVGYRLKGTFEWVHID